MRGDTAADGSLVVPVEHPAKVVEEQGGGPSPRHGWWGHLGSFAFLAPGAIWLLIVVAYSMVATVRDSFLDSSSNSFVGLQNYQAVFSTADILIALRNNVVWVVVFPFVVTFLGLLFAVLTERVRWSTAFKTIMFMPIVFSMTASAMVWRAAMDINPKVGMINATLETVSDWFNPPGPYPIDQSAGQKVSNLVATGVRPGPSSSLESKTQVSPGKTIHLGLVGIPATTLQMLKAAPAVPATPQPGAVTGVVWRDFSPSHPQSSGKIYPDEDGIPALHLTLVGSKGQSVASAVTGSHGDFKFTSVPAGSYTVRMDSSNFSSGFTGIPWLGSQSLTPTSSLGATAQAVLSLPLVDFAMIIAYLWIWAGFAMTVVGAGLAALNREVLEAARIDGATEWQTLRRVTIPMLAPVLVVVFVTMIINVLKIFDIIVTMPGSAQGSANTLASEMYFVGFTGTPQPGIASAIAVILFVLVVPAMLLNLKRIRG